ncbi:shisa family member 2a [Chanos chanos]|uniref:Shisa family member 2a n=1 Tax=Chanos chanos TaxID=29144 RepID=A0A6J2WV63_CHACN|nr:protein shisa-1-like [Chanos chanos]
MGSPATSLFFLLIFVARLVSVQGSGEYCHGWSDSYNSWHRGFQCPERYDGEEARYCCGTCALRYCCTSVEARLDQSTCDVDQNHDSENEDKIRKMIPNVPMYLPFVIVVSAFLSFVLMGLLVSVCCCQCLKPKAADRQPGPVQAQTGLLASGTSSPESSTPSRSSSSGAAPQLPAADVAVSVFGPVGNLLPAPPLQHYSPHAQGPAPFYPPYLGYALPPDHTLLMGPAFIDSQTPFGEAQGQAFAPAAVHIESVYRGVSI